MQFMDMVLAIFGLATPWLVLSLSDFPYRRQSSFIALATSLFAPFLSIVLMAKLEGDRLVEALATFDLDGDGSFSGAELTPAALEAMQRYSNDTGLAMALVFGFIVSLVYVAVVGFLVFGFKEIRNSSSKGESGQRNP
jgi:hypothetical protein